MWYLYMLSWISIVIQSALITLSIGAGLYYLAEIVEEYASSAKRVILYAIAIDTFLAFGLFLFEEDLPFYLTTVCIICNLLYYLSVRYFPIVNLTSFEFIMSIIMFMLHNYLAFSHFTSTYYEFNIVLCYMTIFCWLIPIGLLVSCSANDNVLPTTYASDRDNDNLVTNYFKAKGRKLGFLSLMRYFNKNYLPTIQSRKSF